MDDKLGPVHALGIDIGGAAIKAADGTGERTESWRFALWKTPEKLAENLLHLGNRFQPRHVAITMTGELCDCFRTKADGVRVILEAVQQVFGRISIDVWSTSGEFLSIPEALSDPWRVAASNWHALATFAGRRIADKGQALLLDMGSTTTDVIPLQDGAPAAAGKTDPERLATGELVYTGVERTPVAALLSSADIGGKSYHTMAELFATTLDVYLMLEHLIEDPTNYETADGQAATRENAITRLARMIGSDATRFTEVDARQISQQAANRQQQLLRECILRVVAAMPQGKVDQVILSGQGEFVLRNVLSEIPELRDLRPLSLASHWNPAISKVAPAYAVAALLAERV